MSTDEIIEALKKLKKGDMSAFDSFYNNTKRTTFYGAFAILKDYALSEDVLQDVYIKFLSTLDKVDENRGVVALLATLARNEALNIYNREKRNVELLDEHSPSYQDTDKYNEGELFTAMRKYLTDEEYELVVLHVIDDLKHKEISEIMNLPLGTVTWKYNNAIQKLKKGLGGKYEW